MQNLKNLSDPVKYGLVVFAAVLFVGWSTGMGGSFLPNLAFSALVGVLAGWLFHLIKKYAGQKNDANND